MGKPKLEKFAELEHLKNVFDRDSSIKGKWATYFDNKNPIVLELACGKGEYARGMSVIFPDKNFIGVDIKGNRLWTAAQLSIQGELRNVAFIREQIDLLEEYFCEGEIDEIWIIFPDPFLKKSRAKKRLTAPKFLEVYKRLLKKGGLVNLKTDSPELYNYTLEVIRDQRLTIIENHSDIYKEEVTYKTHNIQTHYEKMHLKNLRTIKYLQFKLD